MIGSDCKTVGISLQASTISLRSSDRWTSLQRMPIAKAVWKTIAKSI
jgi:hypothetical protein